MTSKRKFSKNKRFQTSKTTKRQNRDDKQDKKLMNIDKKIRKLNEKEVKYTDFYVALGGIPVTPVINNGLECLNLVGQGVSNNTNRIGNTIDATSVQVKTLLRPGSVDALVRIIIFWFAAADGTTPLILSGASGQAALSVLDNSTVLDACLAPYNRATMNAKVFTILYDKTINLLSTQNIGDSQNGLFMLNKKIKLARKVAYNAAAGATSSIWRNALYIAVFTDTGVTPPSWQLGTRFNYVDDE